MLFVLVQIGLNWKKYCTNLTGQGNFSLSYFGLVGSHFLELDWYLLYSIRNKKCIHKKFDDNCTHYLVSCSIGNMQKKHIVTSRVYTYNQTRLNMQKNTNTCVNFDENTYRVKHSSFSLYYDQLYATVSKYFVIDNHGLRTLNAWSWHFMLF